MSISPAGIAHAEHIDRVQREVKNLAGGCTIETLVGLCPDLTWNQISSPSTTSVGVARFVLPGDPEEIIASRLVNRSEPKVAAMRFMFQDTHGNSEAAHGTKDD